MEKQTKIVLCTNGYVSVDKHIRIYDNCIVILQK